MKNNKGFLLLIAIFSIFTLTLTLLSGCTESPVTPVIPTPKVSTGPQYGGILRMIVNGGIVNIGDPIEATATNDNHVNRPVTETLLRVDTKGALIPWLATGWQVGSDQKSITLTLQKGVKFHDGTDFNAEAAKFNLDRFKASPRQELSLVTSVDVVDDFTIRLNLKEFDNTILTNLAYFPTGPGMMISPTAVKTHPKDWLLTNPVGTGPFKLESYKPDVLLKFTKWEGYWQKGKPYLDGVEIQFIADQVTNLMMMKAGETDSGPLRNPRDAFDLEATGKFSFIKTTSNVLAMLGDSSHADSPFNDVRVRRAISYAIDSKAIADGLGQGIFIPSNQPASPDNWYYSPGVKGYPFDLVKAKALLAEAGYSSGFKTSLVLRSQDSVDSYVAVQAFLKAAGIDLKLEQATTARYNDIVRGGWQNSMIVMSIRNPLGLDPTTQAINNFATSGKQYVSIIHPKDVENTINLTRAEPAFDKRKSQFNDLFKMIIDDYCLVNTLYVNKASQMNSVKLHDSQIGIVPGQWLPESAWLDK
jgi:peptide/nickel transport system substrate-binding protein